MTNYDNGRFVWFELLTNDTDAAYNFYGEVVGWKAAPMDMPGGVTYAAFKTGETPVGGFTKPPQDSIPPHWVSYVSVDDVDATAEKVVANGGKALMDAFDVPNVGRMQPVADPHGAAFFLFKGANGDAPGAEGPGSFHWNELLSADPEAAVAFYEKTLGYTHETMDMPGGTYFVLKNGDKPRGGVVKPEAGAAPGAWTQYVTVDDCDACVARAEANGGKVLTPAMTVPGVGRFAIIADPEGAKIGVMKPA